MVDLEKARKFAANAHFGQVRKYTGEPYVNHPISVSQVLTKLYPDASDEMIAAAILHDTVEDTDVELDEIELEFGHEVKALVFWLTDVSKKEDGNRAARKAIDLQHTKSAPFDAQVIKLADVIDNTSNIVEHDRRFAKVYLKEKSNLLSAMRTDVKDTHIWHVASKALQTSKSKL